MKPKTMLFLAALALGVVDTFVVASEPFWILQFFKPTTSADVNSIVFWFSIASLVIDPAATFLVMFALGFKMAESLEFPSSLFPLLLGAVVGTYTSLAAITAYSWYAGLFQAFIPQLGNDLLYDAFGAFRLALVAFASLAFAYFVRRGSVRADQIVP